MGTLVRAAGEGLGECAVSPLQQRHPAQSRALLHRTGRVHGSCKSGTCRTGKMRSLTSTMVYA